MGRKYISQQNVDNFIYPNNVLAQYGVEIVHNINNNSVSGTVTNFTGTSISSSGITMSFNYTWSLNGAEPFVDDSGDYNILSVHMMDPTGVYYKPWRLVYGRYASPTTGSTGAVSVTLVPSQMGISSFSNGTYYFEIRMIGKKSVQPICESLVVSSIVSPTPTPTPTPSPTPSGGTPTPTPTPSPTAGSIYTSGATLNVTDPGWIKYDMSSGTTYQFINTTGTVTLTNCLVCSTINFGFPFADLANFTVTNCGTSCGGAPAPTPTPSATPGPVSYVYYVLTDCQTYQTKYSQQLVDGTYNSGDRVMGSFGYYYVVSGTVVSTPDPSLIFFVTATGDYGCP
jgi:hypothetical protein